MSNDASDNVQSDEPVELSLQDIGLRGALTRAIKEHQLKELGPHVEAPLQRMLALFQEGGQSDLVVQIDGETVGKYKVNQTRAHFEVADADEFLAFAEERGEVDIVITVKPSFKAAMLQRARRVPGSDTVFDSETGEELPGIRFVPGGRATGTVTWTWEKHQGVEIGREVLMRAAQDGRLDHLLHAVPELMPATPSADTE
ncbi:hypothetical protein HHL19_35270 [Streptomyces sp. R302]|uniref:hypothetical protein n=1 Tax=unclassified Streptomyces TaxID=2593676 RepID=UPI00145CCD66|nr:MULTISPECIES: hypothetical protein [unclassified Streptomyces]NML55197.1 hypothetical protein [Streptomyces sp. R301]NML83773.1 hypothetical protein [Streptomyces sp. R302]